MSATARSNSYGEATLLEKIGFMATTLLYLPTAIVWTLVTSSFRSHKRKSWKRIIFEAALWHATLLLNARQMQWVLPASRSTYEKWAKANGVPIIIDELGQDARLLWIGERKTDKVILYIHGGALLLPLADGSIGFWKYVQDELRGKGKPVSVAILNYSLVPTATFPTQLTQAVLAVQHLISSGISPSDIQLTGDSAGGNIIFQLISHILHPVPSVDILTLSAPFAGIYMMSPWVWLTTDTGSMITNDKSDQISRRGLLHWGTFVLEGLPDSALPYMDAAHAPEGWFSGIQGVAERVLISAGDKECLRDGIVNVGKVLSGLHPGVRLIVQDDGVHCDPGTDFLAPTWEEDTKGSGKAIARVGELTSVFVGWLADGWKN